MDLDKLALRFKRGELLNAEEQAALWTSPLMHPVGVLTEAGKDAVIRASEAQLVEIRAAVRDLISQGPRLMNPKPGDKAMTRRVWAAAVAATLKALGMVQGL